MGRLLVPVLVLMALVAGITLGGHPNLLPGPVRDVLVGDKETRVILEAVAEVEDSYYREIGEEELVEASLDGLVGSLDDRFSHYLNPEEYERFNAGGQSYAGIGISVNTVERGLLIVEVYDESPAQRAGLRRNEVITEVEGESIAGREAAKGSDRIRGTPGTKVTLTVARRGKEREVTVTRARVTVPVVASRMVERDGTKYGYVKLAGFSSGAHGEVIAALKKLVREGAEGIVFDLRGNGGGLVSEAKLIAGAFLDDGQVIVTMRGRAVDTRTLKADGDPAVAEDVPVVVLVDRNSASASEIVAGALQDHDRAEVVGRRTFGKGVFQSVIELSNGGALDITAGQYFTPDGRNLGGKGVKTGTGIEPDVEALDKPKTRVDEALEVALQRL